MMRIKIKYMYFDFIEQNIEISGGIKYDINLLFIYQKNKNLKKKTIV